MNLFSKLIITTIFLFGLFGCDVLKGISAHKVDDIVKNPRVYEEKEITVVGNLQPVPEAFKLVGIGARLQGNSPDNNVYLMNYAAKIDFNQKVMVTGVFETLPIPLLGTFLVIDAKSVIAN
jgi:hypothetical protein